MDHLKEMTIAPASKRIQLGFLRVKPQFLTQLQKKIKGNVQSIQNVQVWEGIAVHLMKALCWSVVIR
jgi:hypothetical protein